MLGHEDEVKGNAQEPKAKLDNVARDARPVARDVGIENQLCNAEGTASKVQEDVVDRPPDG